MTFKCYIMLKSTAAILAAAMFVGDRMTASTPLAGMAAVSAGSLLGDRPSPTVSRFGRRIRKLGKQE